MRLDGLLVHDFWLTFLQVVSQKNSGIQLELIYSRKCYISSETNVSI